MPEQTVDITESIEPLRDFVIQRLREASDRTGNGRSAEELRPTRILGSFAYELEGNIVFTSLLWRLVGEGLIVPGAPSGAFDGYHSDTAFEFPKYTITPLGRLLFESPDIVHPRDLSAYMNAGNSPAGPVLVRDDVVARRTCGTHRRQDAGVH